MFVKSLLFSVALLVVIGVANASFTAAENLKPVYDGQLTTYMCDSTDCQNCTLHPVNPNATYRGNCQSANGISASGWIYPNGTLLVRSFSSSDCSGRPAATTLIPTDKCLFYYGTQSMIVYYNKSAPPTPAPANSPIPAMHKYLKQYTCTTSDCQNCVVVLPNPNTTFNGNCASLRGQSVSEWIYTNNNTLQSRAYASSDCSGPSLYTSNLPLDKCIALGGSSMIVKYEDGPSTPVPTPPTRHPALVKDIKPFTCNGTECNGCTLQKLGPNVTIRGNCAMFKNQGYSMSYYLVNNGATLEMHYFDNTLCTDRPLETFNRALNKCIIESGYSEIIYYTGGSSTTFDDVPFVVTEEFSFTKNIKK